MERVEAFKIFYPANIIVVGGTHSGKSYFTLQLLKKSAELFQPPIHNRYFLYKYYQKEFDKYVPDIIFVSSLEQIPSQDSPALVAVDDHLNSLDKNIVELFVAGRHKNLSPIYLTQYLFHSSPLHKTITVECKSFHFHEKPKVPGTARHS